MEEQEDYLLTAKHRVQALTESRKQRSFCAWHRVHA